MAIVEAHGKLYWLENPDDEVASRKFLNLVRDIIRQLPKWAAGFYVFEEFEGFELCEEVVDYETGETSCYDMPSYRLVVMPVVPSKFGKDKYYYKRSWKEIKVKYDPMLDYLKDTLVLRNGEIYVAGRSGPSANGFVTVYLGELLAKISF